MDGSGNEKHRDNQPIIINIELGGVTRACMVDTGASDCFISKEVRDTLIPWELLETEEVQGKRVKFGDKSLCTVDEKVRLRCNIGGATVCYTFNVLKGLIHPVILGRDILTDMKAEIKVDKQKIELYTGNPVSSMKPINLDPFQEMVIPVEPWRMMEGEGIAEVMLEPSFLTGVCVENCINTIGKQWWIKIANLGHEKVVVECDEVLAYANLHRMPPVNVTDVCAVLDLVSEAVRETTEWKDMELYAMDSNGSYSEEGDAEKKEGIKETRRVKADKIRNLDLGKTALSQQEEDEFKEMLVDNMDTLAFDISELGHCTLAPMKMRVDETQGICSTRPYRYSPQKMDIIDEQIQQLLDLDVIEPSESAWRSPIVVVTKKDGKPRICTDFRVLNLLTAKDKYPMPTARSLFLYMASRKPTVFTALDLLSGYHQCELHEDSRKYTCFESSAGVWQWKRIPFGLVGAPWQFTKVMSLALRGLVPRICLAYLDDIIVFDPDFQTHKENVERVLKALGRAGLKLKPSKCEWCRDEIAFLGHIVSSEGLATQPRILHKVKEFVRPHSPKTVKSFLGLCNYYRAFIPSFAVSAVPLNRLLRKNVTFNWTEECEEAFRTIQKCLVTPPLLIHPQLGGHFYVLTDASDTACGSAICHKVDDLLRPITYYGYTFGAAEMNYTVTEREGLAVVKTLKTFEDMMQGGKITIVTDHQPLIPLLQQAHKAPSKRLKRWALALTDYDFEIQYEPGQNHCLPDYLSRMGKAEGEEPSEEEEEFEPEVGCELLAFVEDRDEIDEEEIRVEQEKDPECNQMIRYLQEDEFPDDWGESQKMLAKCEKMGMNVKNILCKYDPAGRKTKKRGYLNLRGRIVVPPSLGG